MCHMVSILLASYVNVTTDVCDNSEQAGQAVLSHILSIYLNTIFPKMEALVSTSFLRFLTNL